jgi:hypothetical protein
VALAFSGGAFSVSAPPNYGTVTDGLSGQASTNNVPENIRQIAVALNIPRPSTHISLATVAN